MSAERLEAALGGAGIRCRVEAQDRLAIITASPDAPAGAHREWRRVAVELAREHGFTHVALELPPA